MFESASHPRLRSRLASSGRAPESPNSFPGLGTIGVDKTTSSFVAAGGAGKHKVIHHQRCGGRAVVILVIRHGALPNQVAGHAAQGDDMRVVCGHEDLVAEYCYAAVDGRFRIANHTLGERARVMPDLP